MDIVLYTFAAVKTPFRDPNLPFPFPKSPHFHLFSIKRTRGTATFCSIYVLVVIYAFVIIKKTYEATTRVSNKVDYLKHRFG